MLQVCQLLFHTMKVFATVPLPRSLRTKSIDLTRCYLPSAIIHIPQGNIDALAPCNFHVAYQSFQKDIHMSSFLKNNVLSITE